MFCADAHEWLARAVGAAPESLHLERMKGSTSSSVFLVQCSRSVQPARFVLRVLDEREWLADEPDLAAHEAAALEEAHKANLQAPRLVAYASDDAGFGAPVVLMTFLEGDIELRPTDFQAWLGGLARELASIHRHRAPAFAWRYRSWVNTTSLRVPAWTTVPRAWRRAIDLWLGPRPEVDEVFIHRDYHPTNVLWRAGAVSAVSGVVDWINACRGPAGVDVAHCRSNLSAMYGPEAADQFLQAYCDAAETFEYNPYWDVDSLLDGGMSGPSFYPPWLDFGLDLIPPEVLAQRTDAYLEGILRRC